MNDTNTQAFEESQNPTQNIYSASRINHNQNGALARVHATSSAEEEQEQIVTSTSSDTQTSASGHLPRLEALITSPARITSSTGNDCSSSPQRVLSTTCSSSSGRQSNNHPNTNSHSGGDITTTDASSEDESQSPHQPTHSSFVGRNLLDPGNSNSAVGAYTRAVNVLDSAMPTTSAAAATNRTDGRNVEATQVEQKLAVTAISSINRNSISNGNLEQVSRVGIDMVARETTVATIGEGTAGYAMTDVGDNEGGHSQIVPSDQPSENHKIILKLPKPIALGVNTRPNESHSNDKSIIGNDGASSHCSADVTRKVEPLKINLHTHSPNVVPKITIKPIVNMQNDVASSDCSSSADDDAVTESSSIHSNAQLPRLTIKSTVVVGGSDEPHIVPKLTIRSTNDSSDSSVVPKLTIKMSDPQGTLHGNSVITQLSPSTSMGSNSVNAKSRSEHSPPPLPKLTIKTSLDGTSESIISTISPASSSSSSSSACSSGGAHLLPSVTASCTISNTTSSCSVPKLTIKTLLAKPEELVPKLTIKTNAAGACVSTAVASLEDVSEANDGGSINSSSKIPKLTIKTGQEHAVIITQHNDTSNAQIIPKLTIKTKSLDIDEPLSDLSEVLPPPEKIPKITIKTHDIAAEAITSKFCIKPLQQQSDKEHTHAIPKLTISMSSLDGGVGPPSPKQSPLVVRQLSASTRKLESPERLPKLMISRQEATVNNCEQTADKVVPKLTIKTNSLDGGSSECKEKIPKLTIKPIPNVEQSIEQSSEESDECLSGESSPSLSAVEETTANKVVPKLTIKNLSSPKLKMKAVLEDKVQRNLSKKSGKSSDTKNVADTNAAVGCVMPLDSRQNNEVNTREQMVNGCESSSSQEFCGFNNDHAAFVDEADIEEPRRNSDDMDIDEGLQQHDPQVFNNVFHVSNGETLRLGNIEESDLMQPPPPAEDLTNVVDTVDLTSSPSPGSSPAHFTYTDADPQITDMPQHTPQATILMERLQREMSVIQTAPSLENTGSFLLNQLRAPLNATKYGIPPPLQPKPQHVQQQQQISNSLKYPQLTERLMANGSRVCQNPTIICAGNTASVLNSVAANINMPIPVESQPEKVIDSIEILDTPEGSPRLTLGDTAALSDNLHMNSEDGMNDALRRGIYEESSADALTQNSNIREENLLRTTDTTNHINLKRHAGVVPPLLMEKDVVEQCIEITPNKVRRIDSETHTMATLTILTDDESSNTKLITTSPTIFGGNHHCMDITNDMSTSANASITLDLASPRTSVHRSRKQRHEHLLAIPFDEEDPVPYNSSGGVANNCYESNAPDATTTPRESAPEEVPANTPVTKRRGRPKKNTFNSAVTATVATNLVAPALNEANITAVDPNGMEDMSKSRRVQLLRKRLAIDMVDAEQPHDKLENADTFNDTEVPRRDRALRNTARGSRRSILPTTTHMPSEKGKQLGSNGESCWKNRKRSINATASSGIVGAIAPNLSSSSMVDGVSVLNHYGGSNSSLSSACSSSSISSATVTTAGGGQLSIGGGSSISLATQIDLTMCSSSSSASNGSITATMTIAGGGCLPGTGISAVMQNQSSSSMLPPATILSSSDPVPDVVFRPNDFSSLMATQQLRAPNSSLICETDLLRMQTTLNSNRFQLHNDETSSQGVGRTELSGADISGDDSTSSTSTPVGRGRGGRGRGGRGSGRGNLRGSRAHRLGRGASAVAKAIALSRPRCVGGLKHMPDPDRMKGLFSPSPQVFEEDTRMSADLSQTQIQSQPDPQTPLRQPDFLNNDESQSSVVSTNSILDPNTVAAVQNGNALKRPKKKKMEICVAEDAEITVASIAEYEWPPPKGCCPSKNRDTFMIQEQVALYLGIKSFKRKYPDLPRRQIDMEERNWLQEKGLVSERMCDLGITAVWASDILDIMYTDFYGKYEEYKNFIRQKHLREIEAKQKALGLNVTGRGLQARERALLSASKWNSYFNRSRKEERLACLDLQTLTVNVPLPATAPTTTLINRAVAEVVVDAAKAEKIPEPPTLLQPSLTIESRQLDISYPVAVVPGQYCAKYRHYTPLELRCLPLSTVLEDPRLLAERMLQRTQNLVELTKSSAQVQSDLESSADAMLSHNPVDMNKRIVNRCGSAIRRLSQRRNRRLRYATTAKCDNVKLGITDVMKQTQKAEDDSETESALSSSDSDDTRETDSETESNSSTDDPSSSSDDESETAATCGVCQRVQNRNLKNMPELFIRCYTCRRKVHPSCIEMPHRMVPRVRNYNWQCADCKCCIRCKRRQDKNKMLYCEQCDRGFHIYCLAIKAVPDGRWSCDRCSICMRCGATKPEGLPQLQQTQISSNGEKFKQIKHKKVKWINEYRIDHITKLREHCNMLCVPCGRSKNAKRVQIANPNTNTTAPTAPSLSMTATQQKSAKTLAQIQGATAPSNTTAIDGTLTAAADQTTTSSVESANNRNGVAGTLPPPPAVVA